MTGHPEAGETALPTKRVAEDRAVLAVPNPIPVGMLRLAEMKRILKICPVAMLL